MVASEEQNKTKKGEGEGGSRPVPAKEAAVGGKDGEAVVDSPAVAESVLIDVVSPTPTTTTTTTADFFNTTTTSKTDLPDPSSNPFSFSFDHPRSTAWGAKFEPNPESLL